MFTTSAQVGEQPLIRNITTTKIDSVETLSAAGTFLTAAVVPNIRSTSWRSGYEGMGKHDPV